MDVYMMVGWWVKAIRPEWEIVEVTPNHLDKKSHSWSGFSTYYERFWHYHAVATKADISTLSITAMVISTS